MKNHSKLKIQKNMIKIISDISVFLKCKCIKHKAKKETL